MKTKINSLINRRITGCPILSLFSNVGVSFLGLFLFFSSLPAIAIPIFIENNHFKYEIAKDGRNLQFRDKATGVDYLYADSVSYCASIMQGGKEHHVTSVSFKNDLLFLDFGNSGVTAEIRIEKANDHITMDVVSVIGTVESLTFINVPLKLEGMPYEPFAACVLSMNLFTHVRQLPALQTHLWASCYQRFGLKGAKIVLLGVPQKDILPVIRDVMERAEDIPHSTAGGAWARCKRKDMART